MAGILTPPSTGDAPPPAQARPVTPPPPPPPAPPNTLSMNNPLAGMAAPNAAAPPPVHNNQAINEALMNAFRPVVPDQTNNLLGLVIGQLQGHPITYYQPRQAAPVPVSALRRSS